MQGSRNTAFLIAIAALALLFAAAACSSSPAAHPTATVTAVVPSGKDPNASVRGTVTYKEDIPLTPGAQLIVSLRDTSLQDAAAPLIAQQIIEDPGQAPIAFEVEYNRDDIDERNTYSVSVRIVEADGRLAFTNDTAYDVITRGKPDRVDMQLKLVQPPPDLAEQVEGDHRTWVETPPWVIRANRIPNEQEHFLRIEFYQSSVEDCARPGSQSVEVEGNEIAATLTLQQPPDVPWDTGCAAEFVELDAVEPIPGELSSSKPYKVTVNDVTVSTFTLPREGLRDSIIVKSPVQRVEVYELESDPVQYVVEVVSGRPSGSCTQFNGYEIVRRNDNTINVEITHHRIVDPRARCTRDYPIEETRVPLGVLEKGVEYTVTVNGAHEQTVVGR